MTSSIADFDTLPDRSGTGSLKWEKYAGRDVLPFWVADMDFLSPPPVIAALEARARHGVYGYTQAPGEAVDAVLGYLRNRHGLEVDPAELIWLPGLVPALNVVARAFGDPGDGILTATPVYPPFLSCPGNQGKRLQAVPLREADGRWTFDWPAMEAAVTPQTRVLLLCSPHNPVGRVWTGTELEAVRAFAQKHDLIVCSDEIHCDLILDPERKHRPFAGLSADARARSINLFAPSKTYNLPGLACAFAFIPDRGLRLAFKRALQGLITEVNAFGYAGCTAALTEGEPWRQALLTVLRKNAARVRARVEDLRLPVRTWPVEATYLAWIDLRALGLEDSVGHLEAHGIGLSDGRSFQAPGFVRLNFGCPPAHLEEGLRRLAAGLQAAG
ncbi:MAG: MalY/PatB family protein [Opitutales bacterium]